MFANETTRAEAPQSPKNPRGDEIKASSSSRKRTETSPVEIEHLEAELRLTLEELARLQNKLADANIRIHNLQNQLSNPPDLKKEEKEVVDSVVQEIRQPMTSIIGYVDLFLSESAGSLNALQRKFIDRVKASGERMQILLDDLCQITAIRSGHFEIHPESVNVNEIIDQSLMAVSGQMREKNLSMRLDVPKKLAPIEADYNSLKQIFIRLLQNACISTPNDQSISFRAKIEASPTSPRQFSSMRIQVTDSGGGIPPDELNTVFLQQYRAEKPLLKGVGDTGIGLTIAKYLVEAHGGNIWVESDLGKTTTINVLLPTHSTQTQ
jgi:signal transduction histidine kinase